MHFKLLTDHVQPQLLRKAARCRVNETRSGLRFRWICKKVMEKDELGRDGEKSEEEEGGGYEEWMEARDQ